MNPPYDYDLIVIGAGIAGMVSAMKANGLGRWWLLPRKTESNGSAFIELTITI